MINKRYEDNLKTDKQKKAAYEVQKLLEGFSYSEVSSILWEVKCSCEENNVVMFTSSEN